VEDLAAGNLGKEASYDIDLKDGKLIFNLKYDGSQVDGSVQVAVAVDGLLDKLKEKIPGKIDDSVIDLLKVALKGL